MSRYVRKTVRQSWSEAAMQGAIEAMRRNDLSLKKASQLFHVPRTTLQRRHRSIENPENAAAKRLGSRVRVFTREMEEELVQHIKNLDAMLFWYSNQTAAKWLQWSLQ